MLNTSDGYHDSCGEISWAHQRCSVLWGFQHKSKSSIIYLPYMVYDIPPIYWWHSSNVLNIPLCSRDIPIMNYDIPLIYWTFHNVFKISPPPQKKKKCTERLVMYWASPNVLNWHPIQGVIILPVVLNFMKFIFTKKYYVGHSFQKLNNKSCAGLKNLNTQVSPRNCCRFPLINSESNKTQTCSFIDLI